MPTSDYSIIPFLKLGYTIPDIVSNAAQKLREQHSDCLSSILHANKLLEYLEMITDSNFLLTIKEHFDAIYQICKDLGFLFSLDGRRKSLESLENKIELLLSKNCSLDLLRDIFAFRIVIFDTDNPEKSVKNCYLAMEKIILYLSSQGFIPCESVVSTEPCKFDPQKLPNIYVPQISLLHDEFHDFVKDYISKPKSNGYQSLHASFRDSKNGRFFEVQIRTASMHIHAEHHTANHDTYKKEKYSMATDWNLSEISVNGFYYISEGIYEDFVGLIDPLIIFSRRHTF